MLKHAPNHRSLPGRLLHGADKSLNRLILLSFRNTGKHTSRAHTTNLT